MTASRPFHDCCSSASGVVPLSAVVGDQSYSCAHYNKKKKRWRNKIGSTLRTFYLNCSLLAFPFSLLISTTMATGMQVNTNRLSCGRHFMAPGRSPSHVSLVFFSCSLFALPVTSSRGVSFPRCTCPTSQCTLSFPSSTTYFS